jgi:hypothetical protein
MLERNVDKLFAESMAIEAEDAKQAGTLGYMARALTQATMPHKEILGNEFTRRNGNFTLSMVCPIHVGLPYGSYPRLLLSWLTTEAVRTKSPILELGPSLSAFMAGLGLIPTGGRWGTIHRLRDQMKRLFSATVSCDYADDTKDGADRYLIAKQYRLWWDPKSPAQVPLWKSTVTLYEDFFREIIERPVPIDMRALKALKRSPLALDIYCWLTYRMFYLRKPTEIPWSSLQLQFGADYPTTGQGLRDFKKNFLKHRRCGAGRGPRRLTGGGSAIVRGWFFSVAARTGRCLASTIPATALRWREPGREGGFGHRAEPVPVSRFGRGHRPQGRERHADRRATGAGVDLLRRDGADRPRSSIRSSWFPTIQAQPITPCRCSIRTRTGRPGAGHRRCRPDRRCPGHAGRGPRRPLGRVRPLGAGSLDPACPQHGTPGTPDPDPRA